MPVVRVRERRQVVIPKEIFDKLHLEVGTYLEARLENGKIVYIPQRGEERDEWYWSKEGQQRIQEALEDIEEDRVIGPFKTAQAAIKALKRSKP